MLQKFMEAVQAWITEHVVPVMNKLTSTYWFGVISDAVLYIVPFSMVSAIPSLWNIIRRFCPDAPRSVAAHDVQLRSRWPVHGVYHSAQRRG